MSSDLYTNYRGDVRAVAATEGCLLLVTVHPEGQSTSLYLINLETNKLHQIALPTGGVSLLVTPEGWWIGGTDRGLHHIFSGKGSPEVRVFPFEDVPRALAPLSAERLAVAVGAHVAVVDRKEGRVLQQLDLPENVTCLAADPTGQWLTVGTTKGTVAVFECETDPATFQLSDSQPLHEAAVTALLYEPDELRFLSAGADQKLLSTHARGRLEAEDRGRGANHEEPITAMIAGPAERFLTGSSDKTLKSWPRGKGARPVTLKEGLGKVVGLAVVSIQGKPQVVAACQDNTLRFFHLDEEGKFGEAVTRIHGAEDWAKNELARDDPKAREAALRALADFADASSVKILAEQMKAASDHALRLLACQLLADCPHPRAVPSLEGGLNHADEAVRLAAFDGLRRRVGPTDLRPLVLALKAEKADVGQKAVQALEELAPRDDQAMAQLHKALESKVPEICARPC